MRDRLLELFNKAKELSPEERERFLDSLDRESAEEGRELRELLLHDSEGPIPEGGMTLSTGIEVGEWSSPKADGPLGRLGDFELIEEIGRGGMGIVYEAEQLSLRRRVALKVLPGYLTLDERALARFQQEAEITARLSHSGIIDIHQIGQDGGVHFIAMELIQGTSLDKKIGELRRQPSAQSERVGIEGAEYVRTMSKLICDVAGALDHAHQAGVIHRDVKPSNILIRSDGTAVLTDFGLAREEGLPAISRTGEFAGTPSYVAPEQAMSGRTPVDHRADVFALGATLYEVLTLRPAFPGQDVHEVLSKIISKPPIPPKRHNPALSRDLVTIIYKALEKDPDRRYPSAGAFFEDLRAFLELRPIRARRISQFGRALQWAKREPQRATLLGVSLLTVGLAVLLALALGKLEKLDPETIPSKASLAFLSLQTGAADSSLALFEDILALDDSHTEARCGKLLSLLALGRADEAADSLTEEDPVRLQIDVLRAAGRNLEASELEELKSEPSSAEAHYLAALHLLRDIPLANLSWPQPPVLEGMSDVEPALIAGRDPRDQYREMAKQAMTHLDAAVGYMKGPRATYACALAYCAWITRDKERAAQLLRTFEENWPDSPATAYYAGLIQEVVDQQSAIDKYAQILDDSPTYYDALKRRTALLILNERCAEAISLIQSVPRDAVLEAHLADAFWREGRYSEAIEACKDALAENPSLVVVHGIRGLAYYKLGNYQNSRRSFGAAIRLEESSQLYNNLGQVEVAAGNLDVAAQEFVRAQELDPDYPYAYFNHGVLERDKGLLSVNRDHLRKAIGLHTTALAKASEGHYPSFPVARVQASLGACLRANGDWQAAQVAFEKAIAADSNNLEYYLALGQLHCEVAQAPVLQEEAERARGRAVDVFSKAIEAGLEWATFEELMAERAPLKVIREYSRALIKAGRHEDASEALGWGILQAEERGSQALLEGLLSMADELEGGG